MGFASSRRPAARARELLSDLGLGHRIDHLPRQLSGGESQRVAVAVALGQRTGSAPRRRGGRAAGLQHCLRRHGHDLHGLPGAQPHGLVRDPRRAARRRGSSVAASDRSQGRRGMTMDATIAVDSVIVEHQTSSGPVRALDGVTFSVASGSSVAITGPSGGGKSTLLGVIGGLAQPTSGSVRIGDSPISSCPSVIAPTFAAVTSVSFIRLTICCLFLRCWKMSDFSFR